MNAVIGHWYPLRLTVYSLTPLGVALEIRGPTTAAENPTSNFYQFSRKATVWVTGEDQSDNQESLVST